MLVFTSHQINIFFQYNILYLFVKTSVGRFCKLICTGSLLYIFYDILYNRIIKKKKKISEKYLINTNKSIFIEKRILI